MHTPLICLAVSAVSLVALLLWLAHCRRKAWQRFDRRMEEAQQRIDRRREALTRSVESDAEVRRNGLPITTATGLAAPHRLRKLDVTTVADSKRVYVDEPTPAASYDYDSGLLAMEVAALESTDISSSYDPSPSYDSGSSDSSFSGGDGGCSGGAGASGDW